MKRLFVSWTIGAAVLGGGFAVAQAQPAGSNPPMAMTAPPPASKFLGPDVLTPALVLPPPPTDGSPAALAELAELHRIEAARTPAALAAAQWDADHEDVMAFAKVMGPDFDVAKLPATAALFKDLRKEDSAAAKRGKAFFMRTRPWVADPSLKSCPHGDDTAKSAYPSGHTTMAYAAAGVLVRLEPAKAQAILARAAEYSENRLVCGAHYRRDIVAGQALGTLLAAKLLEQADFRAEFDAARAELKAQHVID